MKTKPLCFSILSLFFAAVILSLPIQVALLFEYSLIGELPKIFHKLSYLNIALMIAASICAIYSYRSHPSLKIWLGIFLLLTLMNNYFVAKLGHDFTLMQTSFASLICFIIPAFLLMPEGLYALNHPHKCYWIPAKRLPHHSKVELKGRLGIIVNGMCENLSRSGLLLNLKDDKLLRVGEEIKLKLPLFNNQMIECQARVVRKTEDHRIALQFENFHFKRFLFIRNLEQTLS